MIAIDLSKQQALNDNSKVIQQINSTANLGRTESTRMFVITEEAKKIPYTFYKEL